MNRSVFLVSQGSQFCQLLSQLELGMTSMEAQSLGEWSSVCVCVCICCAVNCMCVSVRQLKNLVTYST